MCILADRGLRPQVPDRFGTHFMAGYAGIGKAAACFVCGNSESQNRAKSKVALRVSVILQCIQLFRMMTRLWAPLSWRPPFSARGRLLFY